jgi:dTDP-4-dehydrorhamnose reductase
VKILVLGITSLIGNTVFRFLSRDTKQVTFGTTRNESKKNFFSEPYYKQIISGIDAENHSHLLKAFAIAKPDVVINCIGLVKQLADANDPKLIIPINACLPHHLASLCEIANARLIQFSTDCVFSGVKGNYCETDTADANDLYGRTKYLGEVHYPHTITLRTSTIGHELEGYKGLLGWFLAQKESCKGFRKAIFSGLPTVELARVVNQFVIPNNELQGLYHVAAEPINKFELLKLIAETYSKKIEIIPSDKLVIDRSLNANRFNQATGYSPSSWPVLIQQMHAFQ